MAKSRKRTARAQPASGRARRTRSGGRERRLRRSLSGRLLRWAVLGILWGVIALGIVVAIFAHDLPSTDRLASFERRPSVTLVAADGAVIGSYGEIYGEAVQLYDLPPHLIQAVLATEDRRFYFHFGIDLIGVARAALANLKAGTVVQGASTISQQLAKNLFLSPERTLRRKVQESLLALWLEQRFTKDEILTIYLNRAYFGAGAYGVDAAARRFFAKRAGRLSLYEAAMLAGLLKAPSRYNPARDSARAHRRAAQVLRNMVAAGYLSDAEAGAADHATAAPRAAGSGAGGRYFTDWVLDRVSGYVGYPDRDLIVETTLETGLQRLGEAAVAQALAGPGAAAGVSQAALVALAPGGAVRAMVGGRDYGQSQFNRVTQARRQPGSAFKLFVYLAGLESGLAPTDRLPDAAITVDGWTPRNYDGRHHGEMTVREALARSINTVAVRVAERAGRGRVIEVARRLGITTPLPTAPSLALGTGEVTLLELTQAYAVLGNDGAGVWAHGIREIREPAGRILYRRAGSGPGRVIAPGHLVALRDMLVDVIEKGTGRAAAPGRPAAGKTGTSQDHRDAWFVGYTAELTTGVWVGNDDGRAMKGVTGGGLPARLWRVFMTAVLVGKPARALPGTAPAAPRPAGASEDTPATGTVPSPGSDNDARPR